MLTTPSSVRTGLRFPLGSLGDPAMGPSALGAPLPRRESDQAQSRRHIVYVDHLHLVDGPVLGGSRTTTAVAGNQGHTEALAGRLGEPLGQVADLAQLAGQ